MSDAGEDSEATVPLDVAMGDAGEDSDSEATVPLEDQPYVAMSDDDAGEDSEATVPLEDQPRNQQDDNDMEASDSLVAEVFEEDAVATNPIELRKQQRQLHKDIQLASNGCTAKELGKFRDTNNELFGHLKRMYEFKKMKSGDATGAREAVLDGKNLDSITKRYTVNAQSLNSVPRYDAYRLAEQIEKKGSMRTSSSSSRRFNWRGFGIQVGKCFNALPEHCSFLYGPLDADYVPKERKKPERRKKKTQEELSDAEEEQPDTIIQRKNNVKGNELSAVGIHIKKVKSMLKKKSKEQKQSISRQEKERYINSISEGGTDETSIEQRKRKLATEMTRVNASNVLLDRSSFTKTVENINNFSFLVKHSTAGIKVRSYETAEEFQQAGIDLPTGPVIYPVPERDQMRGGTNTQAVLAFSMKDWKRMTQVFGSNDDDNVPIEQRKRPPEDLAREAEGNLVSAGITSQHESPRPAVVTQTDDVEPSGGISNSRKRKADDYGEISEDVCGEIDRNVIPRNQNGGHVAGKRDKQSTPSRSPKRKRSPSRSPSQARSCLEVLDLTQTTPVKSAKQNKRHLKVKKERIIKKSKPIVDEVIDLCGDDSD